MRELIHFEKSEDRIKNKDTSFDTPPKGATVYVRYYPNEEDSDNCMMVPIQCVNVYENGNWDGVLIQGEA